MRTEEQVEEEIEPLVPDFLNNLTRDLKKNHTLLETNSFHDLARFGHKIKGIARPYGFPTLEDLARAFEQACLAQEKSKAHQLYDEMTNYVSKYSQIDH